VALLSADFAGQHQAAFCHAYVNQPNGVILDARGFVPPVTMGSNIFSVPNDTTGNAMFGGGNGKYGMPTPGAACSGVYCNTQVGSNTVLWPAGTITQNVPLFMPQQSSLIGEGGGGLATRLTPNSSVFPFNNWPANNCNNDSAEPCLVQLCFGGQWLESFNTFTYPSCSTPSGASGINNTPRIQVSGIILDTGSPTSTQSVAVACATAQEKSWLQNSSIIGFTKNGIVMSVLGQQAGNPANLCQNSGPWTNLEINYHALPGGSNCQTATNTVNGIKVSAQGPSITIGVGGHITFNSVDLCPNGDTAASQLIAVNIGGLGVVAEDIHAERYGTAVQVGFTSACTGCHVADITTVANMSNGVVINSGACCTGVIENVNTSGSNNTLVDNQNGGFTIGSGGVSLYTMGVGASPNNNVLTGPTFFGDHINQVSDKNFAGSCTMAAAQTCTWSLNRTYTAPHCTCSGASSSGATTVADGCAVSGTTVTVWASAVNSLVHHCIVAGGPN
jgi:hypothetical protein